MLGNEILIVCFFLRADFEITTHFLVLISVSSNVFDIEILGSSITTCLRTETHVRLERFLIHEDTRITWSIATIFTGICRYSSVDTFTDGRMCLCITYLRRDTTIKCIKVAEPITVVIRVYIFYNTSFKPIDILHSCLVHHRRKLLTTNAPSTIPQNFLTTKGLFILFE
jgi:hypothetical protein